MSNTVVAPVYEISKRRGQNGDNKLSPEDRPAHDWYRFVLSFPPHLVRDYLSRFAVRESQLVLDPFCGTGTTLVECKKFGIPSIGFEANPMAAFASSVKLDWSVDPDGLMDHAAGIASEASLGLRKLGLLDDSTSLFQLSEHYENVLRTLPEEQQNLLLTNSISPLPLHKALVLLDTIKKRHDDRYQKHESLAFAKIIVYSASNLNFGPEVGLGVIKRDAPVIDPWLFAVEAMANDLRSLRSLSKTRAIVYGNDAREMTLKAKGGIVDAVITSPPYPNEKDYTRTTRLESVLLGFISTKRELQDLKRRLVRSNTRNVYKGDDDDLWVASFPEIQRIADAIEKRRIELGKTSGFERLYAKVTKLYFGGMARHLSDLRPVLRPGARLAYVVGDQASYLRVMIRTGKILADIAQSFGYELVGIDLFRTRLATATKEQLREEVVLLRWPG